ncbi:MAG: hypothetical protein J3Q66DRAFT_323830 [Benniella sp.]|nr:MAG: hypothetical protein J3Q66DRAFT_323830 [Benniella sp.]
MNPPFFNGQPAGPLGQPLPGGHHPGGPMVSPPGGEGFPPAPVPPPFLPPNWLPPGWTEHKAPDGMAYYYNASTGTSSWIRPTLAPPPLPPGMPGFAPLGPPPPPGVLQQPPPGLPGYPTNQQPLHPPGVAPPALAATSSSKEETGKGKKSKKVKKEKAVKKTQVLESPWFIVVTNLENTFFYNKETKASIWVPTPELQAILEKMGQAETEKLEAERKAKEAEEQARFQATKRPHDSSDSQEGEKRARNESEQVVEGTEMTEDDIAWQLAAMEGIEDQDQDVDHHMDSQSEEEDEMDEAMNARLRMLQGSVSGQEPTRVAPAMDLEISQDNVQEREMAFIDMMRDRGVTQFDTWEMALARIEHDPRIRLIPNVKDRRELFENFCVTRAREIKEAKEKEAIEKEQTGNDDRDRKGKEKRSSESKSHSMSSTLATESSSKPEDVYRRLMEDYTTKTSTWLDFMTKYRLDPRFLGLKPGSLRESIFRQYLSDLKKGVIQPKKRSCSSDRDKQSSSRSSSRKYKATDAEIDEFMSLLRETKKDILYEHKHSSSVEWRKIKKLIDRDRRYDAVGSSTERELIFREYADRVIQRRD